MAQKPEKSENNVIQYPFFLIRNEEGKVLNYIENYERILINDKFFMRIRLNELSWGIEYGDSSWDEYITSIAAKYIQTAYHITNDKHLKHALRCVAKKNAYHPVQDLIKSLKWDGTERISRFLTYSLKAEDTPYTREVSRLIFAGGIHRAFRPGCKFDDMPVLIGTKQGEGKSTLIAWLAMEDKFTSSVPTFDGQKGQESIRGKWICDVEELLALTKHAEVEGVKAFITRQSDYYRAPYAEVPKDYPRQCIFIGNSNRQQFLVDKTGNRRFYPVRTQTTGYELYERQKEIKEYIQQCWAEAYELFNQDKLPPYALREVIEEIRQHQADALEDDWRVGAIKDYLLARKITCVKELWKYALGNSFKDCDRRDSNEISLIMQGMEGWERSGKSMRLEGFGVQKAWTLKEDSFVQLDMDIERIFPK